MALIKFFKSSLFSFQSNYKIYIASKSLDDNLFPKLPCWLNSQKGFLTYNLSVAFLFLIEFYNPCITMYIRQLLIEFFGI
jgi:hypothetical protein